MTKKTITNVSILFCMVAVMAIIIFAVVHYKKTAVLEETVAVFSNQPGQAPYSDLLGNPVSLNQYLGKVLVVVSWASWSPFSKTDIEMLLSLQKEYSSEEVVFMAINRKETKDQAARYVTTLPPLDGLIVVLDPNDNFYTAVGGYAMPEALVYNTRGEILQHWRGVAPREEIKSRVDELLQNN